MTDAYAKLIEEHKRKLEQFVLESQRMLLEIPDFGQQVQNVPNGLLSNNKQQGKKIVQDNSLTSLNVSTLR